MKIEASPEKVGLVGAAFTVSKVVYDSPQCVFLSKKYIGVFIFPTDLKMTFY
jgi:hypothetical protein